MRSSFLHISICILAAVLVSGAQVPAQNTLKSLETPYYCFPRTPSQHIDLSADWMLGSQDEPITSPSELETKEWINVAYPTSVQIAHFKAGKLGDPYKNLNAREHERLEQKIWYYRKIFSLPAKASGNNILLCFDGIDYFARIWLNGELLGTHEGIFGGPVIDISQIVKYGGNNDLLVEVVSANFKRPDFDSRVPGKIVKGWFLTGGSAMEPYFNLGLWRGVRIEIVPCYHLERPFLFTRSVKADKACLDLSVEIFSGNNSTHLRLHPSGNVQMSNFSFPGDAPQNKRVNDLIKVKLDLKSGGETAFSRTFSPYVIEGRCWLEEQFEVDHPKLWYPNGLGQQDLYRAEVILEVNGKEMDRIGFDFGIRTIEQERSAGVRTGDRWQNWQFVINGKKLFIKGINWMPVDALYDLTVDKYDWAVRMAKNAGIQMFRIWGSGLLESDAFYDACNRYGIMVWQDFSIANFDTPHWPQNVWEAQVCQNIFRLRNQPSLAVWCGGNEFNPYSEGNAASIGILERNLAVFDPTRCFLRTSPDAGSLHSYPDFDPVWYKKFDLVPFVAETGMHCMTDAKTIREVVNEKELVDLGNMYSKEFAASHPEFVEHFAEYSPSRVPRMLSRASHINNMLNPNLESITEATQIGAGEFYQIMSEGFQFNYPVTTGLMPWVYKRPWPVVAAINLVDGYGQPSAPYYFLKRTYQPTRAALDLERILWAPGEKFPVSVKIINGVDQPAFKGKVVVQIFDTRFKEQYKQQMVVAVRQGTSVTSVDFKNFQIAADYKEKYFFVVVRLSDEAGRQVSAAEYWPRTIRQMEDQGFLNKYCSEPVVWPTLDKGPWLKTTVAENKTSIKVRALRSGKFSGKTGNLSFVVENTGKQPAFMVHFEIETCKRAFFANDNFFWLAPGESKQIEMEVLIREDQPVKQFDLEVRAWNAKPQKETVVLN